MKRRTFLSGLSASAALPQGLMAKTALATVASPTETTLFARAAQWAGLWDQNSPAMLQYRFDLNAAQARALFNRLVDAKIVAKPAANGMGRVLQRGIPNPFRAEKLKSLIEHLPATTTRVSFDASNNPDRVAPSTQKQSTQSHRTREQALSTRLATTDDIPALIAMLQDVDTANADVTPHQIRAELASTYLIDDKDNIAGCVSTNANKLTRLCIRRDHADQRVAKALTQTAISHVADQGYANLFVYAPANERDTLAFFNGMGFHYTLDADGTRATLRKPLSAPKRL